MKLNKLIFPYKTSMVKNHTTTLTTHILFPIRDEVVQNMCEHWGLNQQIYTVHVII
jgi:hypothetical protein